MDVEKERKFPNLRLSYHPYHLLMDDAHDEHDEHDDATPNLPDVPDVPDVPITYTHNTPPE